MKLLAIGWMLSGEAHKRNPLLFNTNPRENTIMLTLPSMWNLIISTIIFFIAAGYSRRYLAEQGLPKSITRGMLVFAFASLMSWWSGEIVDWTQEKIEGPQPAVKTSDNLMQLLKKGAGNSF